MRIVCMLATTALIWGTIAGGIIAGERMPNISALHQMEAISAVDPCGIGKDMLVVFYSTPGLETADYWKAAAAFAKPDRRPFMVSWSDDETDEAASILNRRLYYDYNRDGVADEITPRGTESLFELICAAANKLK